MPKATNKANSKPINSKDLQAVLQRVKASELSAGDKSVLNGILSQSIKLRKLMERSSTSHGGKKVIASLPMGFDLVK